VRPERSSRASAGSARAAVGAVSSSGRDRVRSRSCVRLEADTDAVSAAGGRAGSAWTLQLELAGPDCGTGTTPDRDRRRWPDPPRTAPPRWAGHRHAGPDGGTSGTRDRDRPSPLRARARARLLPADASTAAASSGIEPGLAARHHLLPRVGQHWSDVVGAGTLSAHPARCHVRPGRATRAGAARPGLVCAAVRRSATLAVVWGPGASMIEMRRAFCPATSRAARKSSLPGTGHAPQFSRRPSPAHAARLASRRGLCHSSTPRRRRSARSSSRRASRS
jgi:hypothetical protein